MQIDYPFDFDSRGRTADTTDEEHIRDMIEQVLFTTPGERVNRPTFGSGLLQLVFAPNGQALAGATQMTVQGALQQWLGDVIQVEAVDVQSDDSKLQVLVQYTIRRSQQRTVSTFTREGAVQ
ncbi:MAG TPA: GPW/gp25 family protein [Thermoanaerobaculia bacterium]|jgi:phage baseplate assembly protein W|nr:GPW/gp25 family protein [Thermoanaerobaculia bacterium]